MTPFAGYPSFSACVADKQGKADDPEALCAWLEHETTGKWPGEMTQGLPSPVVQTFWQAFDASMSREKNEVKAMAFADEAVSVLGWTRKKQGWMHQANNQKMETRAVYGVPIFAVGTHNGDKYTAKDLDDMVSAFKELSGRLDPPVKIGHTSDEFNKNLAEKMGIAPEFIKGEAGNGVMAFGWVENLRISGETMYADLTDVPEPVADLIDSKGYKKVSAEVLFDFKDKGKTYPKVLVGLALLGSELPAVRETGLESAAVYMMTQKPDSVIEFALEGETVTYEQLQPVLGEIDTAIDRQMKGKAGVGIIRAMWKELQQKVKLMLEKKQQLNEPDVFAAYPWDQCMRDQMDRYGNEEMARKVCDSIRAKSKGLGKSSLADLPKMPSDAEIELGIKKEEEVMNKEILKMLGLDEKATDDQTVAAVKKLADELAPVKEALGLPPEATVEDCVAKIKEMMGAMQGGGAEMKKFSDRIAQLETRNKALERAGRIAHYKALAGELKAISGTPDELAEELVSIEEKAGKDTVDKLLGRYQEQDKRLIAAGVFKAKGTSAEGNAGEEHAFTKELKTYMAEKHVDEAAAQAALRKAKPDLWRSFMKERSVLTPGSK